MKECMNVWNMQDLVTQIDIEVSKICIGCMSFGKAGTMHDWTLDEKK